MTDFTCKHKYAYCICIVHLQNNKKEVSDIVGPRFINKCSQINILYYFNAINNDRKSCFFLQTGEDVPSGL